MPKSEFDTDGHLPVCICVCGHLSVWDICLCVCVCAYACVWTFVCVYVCVNICLYARVWTSVMCVRATVCPSVCCVFMRVRGHLRVCASVCVRERVDMYVQVCVITILKC